MSLLLRAYWYHNLGNWTWGTILWRLYETKPLQRQRNAFLNMFIYSHISFIQFPLLGSQLILFNSHLEGPWTAQSEASRCFITARVDGQACWKARKRRVSGLQGSLWKCSDRMCTVHMNIYVSLRTYKGRENTTKHMSSSMLYYTKML